MIDRLYSAVSMKDNSSVTRNLSSSEFVVAKHLLEKYFIDDPEVLKKFLFELTIVPANINGYVFYKNKKDLEMVETLVEGNMELLLDMHAEYFSKLLRADKSDMLIYLKSVEQRKQLFKLPIADGIVPHYLVDYTEEDLKTFEKDYNEAKEKTYAMQDKNDASHGHYDDALQECEKDEELAMKKYYAAREYFKLNLDDYPALSAVETYKKNLAKTENRTRA